MTFATLPCPAELGSPAFFADPYPVYAGLRSTAPVFWHEPWQGWVVTRYADVQAVLQDARRFSNAGRQARMLRRLPPEIRAALAPLEEHYAHGGLSNQDPAAGGRTGVRHARRHGISAWATASTTAWAVPWRGWKPPPRCRLCASAGPG
jgi:cytochrome P450